MLPSLAGPLTDGMVTVRLPSAEASDLEAVRGYIDRQLDGCWLPRLPRVPTERVVQGWLDAWPGCPAAMTRWPLSPSHRSRG
jgi:hypothetical protein